MEASTFRAYGHIHRPQAFRQNIFQPSSPPRVVTDPEAAPKRSHLHGLHHHHHHHKHNKKHRHSSSSSHKAKEAVQSAAQLYPPTSFGDLLKQASKSKDITPSHSRKGSSAQGNGAGAGRLGQDVPVELKPPKTTRPLRPDDVERERAKVKAQEEELCSTLTTLSDQSLRTSRKLDDTYYSILEKLSVLRQTIGSLQELTGLTKELHANFQGDTRELTEDIHNQLEGFNNFEGAEEIVKGLEERIKSGREKANVLTKRLEEARKKVQERSEVEKKWEDMTNRRIRILWGILGTIIGVIILAICFQQLRPSYNTNRHPIHELNFGARNDLFEAPIPDDVKEAIKKPLTNKPSQLTTPPLPHTSDTEDDDALRIFDEL